MNEEAHEEKRLRFLTLPKAKLRMGVQMPMFQALHSCNPHKEHESIYSPTFCMLKARMENVWTIYGKCLHWLKVLESTTGHKS